VIVATALLCGCLAGRGVMSDFRECKECAPKPGAPALCSPCFENRRTIGDLQVTERELRRLLVQLVWQADSADLRSLEGS